MQETLALGAIVLSLLSYVLAAIGPSAQSTPSVAIRPIEIVELAGTSPTAIPQRGEPARHVTIEKTQHLDSPFPGVSKPWHLTPAPRAEGRVVFTWLSGSPGERGSAEKHTHAGSGAAKRDEGMLLLKRRDGHEQMVSDPLSDAVLKRYRQYADELAVLRQRDGDGLA